MTLRPCKHCGALSANRMYCSRECTMIARPAWREALAARREAARKRAAAWRAARAALTPADPSPGPLTEPDP